MDIQAHRQPLEGRLRPADGQCGGARTAAEFINGSKSTTHTALGLLLASGAVARAGTALVLV